MGTEWFECTEPHNIIFNGIKKSTRFTAACNCMQHEHIALTDIVYAVRSFFFGQMSRNTRLIALSFLRVLLNLAYRYV